MSPGCCTASSLDQDRQGTLVIHLSKGGTVFHQAAYEAGNIIYIFGSFGVLVVALLHNRSQLVILYYFLQEVPLWNPPNRYAYLFQIFYN